MLLFANWRIKVRPYMKNLLLSDFKTVWSITSRFHIMNKIIAVWSRILYFTGRKKIFLLWQKKYLLWIIQAERCDHLIISYFLFQQSNSITTFVLLTAIASHLDGFGQNPSDKLPVIPLFGLFKDPKLQSQFRCSTMSFFNECYYFLRFSRPKIRGKYLGTHGRDVDRR